MFILSSVFCTSSNFTKKLLYLTKLHDMESKNLKCTWAGDNTCNVNFFSYHQMRSFCKMIWDMTPVSLEYCLPLKLCLHVIQTVFIMPLVLFTDMLLHIWRGNSGIKWCKTKAEATDNIIKRSSLLVLRMRNIWKERLCQTVNSWITYMCMRRVLIVQFLKP